MQLAATRFIKIEGTAVTAHVKSASEAKIAAKEVRQKKREYQHIKKGLTRQLKAAESIANRSSGKRRGFLSRVGSVLGAFGTASARMDAVSLAEKCAQTEEILHNLESVLIQLQGKLLHYS